MASCGSLSNLATRLNSLRHAEALSLTCQAYSRHREPWTPKNRVLFTRSEQSATLSSSQLSKTWNLRDFL
ncbi:hypothetical protein Q7C36_018620 [Tachysurus vachellii]|uniref:Uncharacterized protein n=1 Tax=Tachysurus vachellii TaxID=175792 RepID=A0AA88M055_TACVA|nr:hypothetical protein Q7C36_018620 [Tachysurus vachellii]